MHCAQARNLIALMVGDDLEATDRPEVERHLSQCRSCNEYRTNMTQVQQQLQSVSAEDSDAAPPGLWPTIAPVVQLESSSRNARRFNGWIAAMAIAASVMALVTISNDLVTPRYETQQQLMPGSGARFGPGPSNVNPESTREDGPTRRIDRDQDLRDQPGRKQLQ